jgi:photosystem II stability/assembly factor-like uncharacterized protein
MPTSIGTTEVRKGAARRRVGRGMRALLLALLLAPLLGGCGAAPAQDEWQLAPLLEAQASGTEALLIGLGIVDSAVAWASGTNGRWARTTDGGATWTGGTVQGADSLEFRDVHAVDASTAYVLSIGNGPQSRIYRTDDGGTTWTLQFQSEDPNAFFDCFDFWDPDHGMAFSDSHDGRFVMIETTDGATWRPIPAQRLPAADSGEGGFASSGTCLVVAGDSAGWVGTGASDGAARVLRTTDRGRTWTVAQTPLVRGAAAGITTLAFRDSLNGVAVGGDISEPASRTDNVARTGDGGATWQPGAPTPFPGAAYGVSWVPGAPTPTLVAVGPGGLGYSVDAGSTWVALDTLNHWGVSFVAPDRGWAVGPSGRITRIRLYERRTAR